MNTEWKLKAEEMFPELGERFEGADNPYLLWQELVLRFEEAYPCLPRNQSLIERTYRYAAWCCAQPRGQTADDDLLTCAAVSFYEHIPTCPPARSDMPRWFSLQEFREMERTFRYHLSEAEFADLREHFERYGKNESRAEPG